jgi:hypothetical protein
MPKWSEGHGELGATASCSVRATKAMANCGQKEAVYRRNLVLYMRVGMSGSMSSKHPTASTQKKSLRIL